MGQVRCQRGPEGAQNRELGAGPGLRGLPPSGQAPPPGGPRRWMQCAGAGGWGGASGCGGSCGGRWRLRERRGRVRALRAGGSVPGPPPSVAGVRPVRIASHPTPAPVPVSPGVPFPSRSLSVLLPLVPAPLSLCPFSRSLRSLWVSEPISRLSLCPFSLGLILPSRGRGFIPSLPRSFLGVL